MKKRIVSLTLIVIMLLSISAQATAHRTAIVSPILDFNGKTANCYVEVVADSATDKIEITASLWRGTVCLETWTKSGYEYLYLNETKSVTLGGVDYKLTADVTINGRALSQVSTTARCPLF